MENDSARPVPIEHRTPTESTVKQLYGTAFRCGEPACPKPLYRMNNETGEWILNSRVAHIHARSEGGPRWDPLMSEEDNRSAANLLPLCIEHAFEIDDTPEHFPADMLREWKELQLAECIEMHKAWPLNDAEAAEVVAESFNAHRVGIATAGATTVMAAVRCAGQMAETARLHRRNAAQAVEAWEALREQVHRTTLVYDQDGERLRVEPSHTQTMPHRTALVAALSGAVQALEAQAVDLIAELHAVCAADQRLARWCDWVEAAARQLIEAAGRWPSDLPVHDDQVWPEAIAELKRSSQALGTAWRGETAPEPPEQPQPVSETVETERERGFREHRALLEAAAPWGRVTHRPFDAELYERLLEATRPVLGFPNVLSLLTVGLDATARLAASVARNADDATYRALIHRAAEQRPLAVAAHLLRHLALTAKSAQRGDLQAEAETEAWALLRGETWQDTTVWSDNQVHARPLLGWTASLSSADEVRATLVAALEHNPGALLPVVLGGMAQWYEQWDTQSIRAYHGMSARISDLPSWFPTDLVVTVIQEQLPGLAPADEDDSDRHSDDLHRFASQVLRLAVAGTES